MAFNHINLGERGREPGKHHCVPSENLVFLTVQFKISNPEAKWSEHFLPPVWMAHQELSEGEYFRPVQQNREPRKESSPTVAKTSIGRVSLFIHYAEELKIETFYMSHLRPGWTAEQKWITVTANYWKTLMETEAVFCLSLQPMIKSLLLHVFTRREQNQIHYSSLFFSLIIWRNRGWSIKPHLSLQSLLCHYPYLWMHNCKNQQQIETLVKCITPSPAALEV